MLKQYKFRSKINKVYIGRGSVTIKVDKIYMREKSPAFLKHFTVLLTRLFLHVRKLYRCEDVSSTTRIGTALKYSGISYLRLAAAKLPLKSGGGSHSARALIL